MAAERASGLGGVISQGLAELGLLDTEPHGWP